MSIDGYADDGYAGSSHEAMDNYYRRMDNFARDHERQRQMAKWQASIVYGPEVEWGKPEEDFEAIVNELRIGISGVDAGTELATGKRDYTCYFEATSDQMAVLQQAAPGWRISEYQDDDND